MATDLHGGLVQRQPPPRRFHIYKFRLGFSPHTPAPEPTTELFSPAPVRRSHPFIFTKPVPANHVMAHRRFYVSRFLSVPEHTCSKENLMASLLGTSPCVRNYNIEA